MNALHLLVLVGLLLSIVLSLSWSATRYSNHPSLIVLNATAIALLVHLLAPALALLGLAIVSTGFTIALIAYANTAREQSQGRPTESPYSASITAFIVAGPVVAVLWQFLGDSVFAAAGAGSPNHPVSDILPVAMAASAVGAAHCWARPWLMRRFAVDGRSPSDSQSLILCASGLPWLALMATMFVWGIWNALNGSPIVDAIALTAQRALTALAVAFTVVGFPVAWWLACRVHHAARTYQTPAAPE